MGPPILTPVMLSAGVHLVTLVRHLKTSIIKFYRENIVILLLEWITAILIIVAIPFLTTNKTVLSTQPLQELLHKILSPKMQKNQILILLMVTLRDNISTIIAKIQIIILKMISSNKSYRTWLQIIQQIKIIPEEVSIIKNFLILIILAQEKLPMELSRQLYILITMAINLVLIYKIKSRFSNRSRVGSKHLKIQFKI